MEDFRTLRKPLGIALCFAIVLQFIFSVLERYIHNVQLQHELLQAQQARLNENMFQELYCTDIDMVRYVQKKELSLARVDVFGGTVETDTAQRVVYDGEQHLFYDHSYGYVEIRALQGARPVATLTYYRIWKSGNDNIRAHLNEFGKLCNSSKVRAECSPAHVQSHVGDRLCIDHCYVDTAHLDYVDVSLASKTHEKHKKMVTNYGATRFPFTFVREPISRFVSGYTEVEHRLMKSADKDMYHLPLYQQIGTPERFKEFIQMILKADGSKRYLHDKNVEIPHIAPQIGTFLLAQTLEGKRINRYKLEHFAAEYERLANESGFWGLMDVYSAKDRAQHPSSQDVFKTTHAAYSFLNLSLHPEKVPEVKHVLDDAVKDAVPVPTRPAIPGDVSPEYIIAMGLNRNPANRVQTSSSYLRALCRIYLVDYMCAGYDLPSICSDLAEEYRSLADDYIELNRPSLLARERHKSWMSRVYYWLRFLYAEIDCFFETNPQCVTDIMYGKDSGVDTD
jgi:hypothetical protein